MSLGLAIRTWRIKSIMRVPYNCVANHLVVRRSWGFVCLTCRPGRARWGP